MAILLNINTAFETACVSISRSGETISSEKNQTQKDHASFLEPAIEKVCLAAEVQLRDLDAIAVANGPGSYTGLRVGLASAKALCYALHKPLILLSTLDILAYALKGDTAGAEAETVFCPMIDARRMEVYTALYDIHLSIITEPAAVVLDHSFLQEELENYRVIVGGNGSFKLKTLVSHNSLIYSPVEPDMGHFSILAHRAYVLKRFSDVAYSEPVYLKPVYIRQV